MKSQIKILTIIVLLLSCQNQEANTSASTGANLKGKEFSYSEVVLYDNFRNTLEPDTSTTPSFTQFSPLYIGKLCDSIKLTYKPGKIKSRTLDDGKYKSPGPEDIEVFIDTSKTIGFSMHFLDYEYKSEYRTAIKSYPVFIKNKTIDTLNIGFGDFLPLLTETEDSNGKWSVYERPFIYDCGTGITSLILPPNQIAITALRQKTAQEGANVRVKFETRKGDIHSNSVRFNF